MTLIARDQAGQSGESAPYEFVLPERTFTKPLARAVVEQRKKLVRDPGAPEGVAYALEALTLGGDKVIDDSVVYLALRNAYWRLRGDRSREGIASVVDQLWSTALRIEEGDLPEAERALNAAQDALMQALKEEASPEEIKNLVDELRSALSRYLQALASQQQDKGNMPPQAAAGRRSARVAAGPRQDSQEHPAARPVGIQGPGRAHAVRAQGHARAARDRQFRRERAAAARRPHDEGFERHRLQPAEAARRHLRRQAPAGARSGGDEPAVRSEPSRPADGIRPRHEHGAACSRSCPARRSRGS